jgi:PKD repeat protein
MKLNIIKACALGAMVIAMYSGCRPERIGDGNGLTSPDLTASFAVTPVAGKANYYALNADNKSVLGVKWDLGDGGDPAVGKTVDTVFYPDAGTYTVKLYAIGKGGETKIATQDVVVPKSDPNAGNLVLGSKMGPNDDAFWNHITMNAGVTFAIDNGKMVAKGGNGGHAGIWQAIDVVAGHKYMVDMLASGSGATDTWFEVYVGSQQPVNGQDYSDGGKRLAINTWAGCGKTNFSGKLSKVQCDGAGNTFTAATTGKMYLLIKSGGANLGLTGIAITNVELRGIN